jgi:hypothetical protein
MGRSTVTALTDESMFICHFLKVSCFNIGIVEWPALSKIFMSLGHGAKLRFWFDFFF